MKGYSSLFSYNVGIDKKYISSYYSLNGNSQSYREQYSVYAKMMKKDILNGVYHPLYGYAINPTSQNLNDLVNGNYIVNKRFNKKVPYVVTSDGKIIIGERNGNGKGNGAKPTPHPTLIGGKDPKVKIAGILDIRGGKIYSYDNQSGHYRPNIKSMKFAHEAFRKFPKDKNFIGGNNE